MARVKMQQPPQPTFGRLEGYDANLQQLMEFFDATAKATGKTRKVLAKEIRKADSTLTKYFRRERDMPIRIVADICRALGVPQILAPKVGRMVLGDFFPFETGSWPPRFAAGDMAMLESFWFPASLSKFPEGRLMAGNQAWKDYFPWMPEPRLDRPVDIQVEAFTNPGALESFGDTWPTLASHMVAGLTVFCPGIVPEERMNEIISQCSVNPEFTRLLTLPPADNTFFSEEVTLLCPDGERRPHVMKRLTQNWPDPTAWDLHLFIPVGPAAA